MSGTSINERYRSILQILGGDSGLTVVGGCHFGRDIPGFPSRLEQFTVQAALNGYAAKPCNWSDYEGSAYYAITVDAEIGRISSRCLTPGCKYSDGWEGEQGNG